MQGAGAGGSPLAIVLGTVLDGIPESAVPGLTLLQGGTVSVAMLAAVFLSNLPEAVAATAGLRASGWRSSRVLLLWVGIVAVSGLAALAGFGLFDSASPSVVAFVLAFAGGAILTMLADTMMPEAFANGGRWVGVLTTLGFTFLFPLVFASNLMVDPSTMPGWLRIFVDLNPISAMATAMRGLMAGTATLRDVGVALIAPAALTLTFAPLTLWLYRRQ